MTLAIPAPDPAIAAGYAAALARTGRSVTIQRVFGAPPRTSLVSATVTGRIVERGASMPEPGMAGVGPGAITQGQRWLVVLVADLARARFPLPVEKDDKVIVDPAGGKLAVVEVDTLRRALAGAIEIRADGL